MGRIQSLHRDWGWRVYSEEEAREMSCRERNPSDKQRRRRRELRLFRACRLENFYMALILQAIPRRKMLCGHDSSVSVSKHQSCQ